MIISRKIQQFIKLRSFIRATVIVLAALMLLLGCARSKMTIGVMVPLSGDAAAYGTSVQKGVQLAMETLNVKNVEVVFEDSVCDPKQANNAATKLITIDNVVAIIGELCSSATLAAAPIAEANGVVLLSPASTSPDITDAGDFIFRDVPSDAKQGVFAANLVYNDGNTSVAILFPNEDYGKGFSGVMDEAFTSLGGTTILESFNRGETDVRSQLTKIKRANPDAIFLISNSPDAASAAIRQIKELALTAKLYGSEGLKSDAIAQTPGAEGLIISSVSAGTPDFMARHEQKFGEVPGPFSAQGYDAFESIARAIEAGAKDANGIKNELYTLSFEGVSGTIDYDENGDISGGYELFIVQNGQFVPY
ncbi:branched-chain amino acid transport system substrate-binding protein [Spirochaetota bacterium]|nr:branched-chain amino acid transport system substrate-binding protein [Spirochaetota bacterium]